MYVNKRTLLALLVAVYAPHTLLAQGPAVPFPQQSIHSSPASSARLPSGYDTSAYDALPNIFRNRRELSIPYGVNASGLPGAMVELYVSRDRGQQWGIVARQSLSGSEFRFNAPEDGIYWFATRTIDNSGRAVPSSAKLSPQMKLVVDTQLPELELTADADVSGEVALQFTLRDLSAGDDSLQILYMLDTDRTQWQTVSLQGQSFTRLPSGELSGEIQFQPVADYRYIHLRLVAVDQAGNQTVENRQLEKPRLAQNKTGIAASYLPGTGQVVGASTGGDSGYSLRLPDQPGYSSPSPTATSQLRGFPAHRMTGSAASTSTLQQAPPADAPPSPASLNAPQNQFAPAPPPAAVTPVAPSSRMRPLEIERVPTPTPSQGPTHVGAPAPGNIPLQSNAIQPSLANPPQPFGTPYSSQSPAASTTSTEPASQPTPADRSYNIPVVPESEVMHRRSRQFSLHYEVDAVGSKGIRAVELWSTTDGGRNWAMRGTDADNQSPFDIEVEGPGLYGFGVVVVGGNGLTSPVPQPGEAPQIWVRVDTDAPLVRLNSARYGEGDETGALVIEYTCSDDNLIPRPVSLSFSANPNGPWTTIATGLENTGRYVWPADPRLPRQIYLRIEAQDLAGNVGIEARDTPIAVQGLAPRARIKGLEDIPEAATRRMPQARFR